MTSCSVCYVASGMQGGDIPPVRGFWGSVLENFFVAS
jgi:hypothetical protein